MEDAYRNLLAQLLARRDLAAAQTAAAMRGILTGEWTPAQTAGFLVALKIKGETPAEIAAAAETMRGMAVPVGLEDDSAVDTCGTGGDGAGLFNISTAAAFVAAGAGARVAKHGNRALSGVSGSADVLSALGLAKLLEKDAFPPDKIAAMIAENGFGFMFAPNHHPAVRHAAPVRKELGVRTVFNLLGPLCNPAGVRRQVVGVYDAELLAPYAETLGAAGAKRALVVYGGGLDEITVAGDSDIAEWKDGAVVRRTVSPEDAGLAVSSLDSLRVSSAAESAARIRSVLAGEKGAARDIVLLNAAAALIVAEIAEDFADGVRRAAESVDSNAAQKVLDKTTAAAGG